MSHPDRPPVSSRTSWTTRSIVAALMQSNCHWSAFAPLAVADCTCIAILNWKQSLTGSVPPSLGGCGTVDGSIPPSFVRNFTRSMHSSCDGCLANANGSEGARWRGGTFDYPPTGRHTITFERSIRIESIV